MKKCKEIVISFVKYQPTAVSPMQLNGAVIERLSDYKLLGVIISQDVHVTWNEHCDHIHNKALKRLYTLCSLEKAGLNCDELVLVDCSLVRSVIKYASPIWVVLLSYLEDLLESIQRKALRVIFGKTEYTDAMAMASLDTLKKGHTVS